MEQNYARAFRVIRAAFGLQQTELAARMSISSSQLSLIEAGKRQPSTRVLGALAKAVGIPTTLVALLASTSQEIAGRQNSQIGDLARVLLQTIVSADEKPSRRVRT
jgi:transcriptional regulator with XRE-family HTH domain